MNILSQNALDRCGLLANQHLIVAVSGGQDSMVLAFALVASGFKTSWAHCNFGLRGDESDRDEEFVRKQAKEQGISLHVRHFTKKDFSESGHTNTQAAARYLRYNWFEELSGEVKGDAICIAHHADDQVETLFMNLVRGTGIDGLTGMAWRLGMIVRPMLEMDQSSVKQYARENQIEHVEDSSNASTKYKRNRFRHDVLPVMKSLNPNLVNTILKEQETFEEHALIAQEYIAKTLPKLYKKQGNSATINIDILKDSTAPKLLLWNIIKPFDYTSNQTEEVAKLMDSQSGKTVSSSTHRITRDRNLLVISSVKKDSTLAETFDSIDELTNFPGFEVICGTGKPAIDPSKKLELFDLRYIEFPLTMRTWIPGDRFIPLGMKQEQKISDFLTQAKVSSASKDQVLVMLSKDRLIWVLGHRISDEVKINSETTDYLSVRIKQ
ncbi:MAG: tRNA(Ile)-lysidine synthase [Litorivivens sp.]|jgi:tRNA(Ile)-lysidine synthase